MTDADYEAIVQRLASHNRWGTEGDRRLFVRVLLRAFPNHENVLNTLHLEGNRTEAAQRILVDLQDSGQDAEGRRVLVQFLEGLAAQEMDFTHKQCFTRVARQLALPQPQ